MSMAGLQPEYTHIALSYEDVANDTRWAMGQLPETPFDSILGVLRGGLFVATIVACDLELHTVTTVGTSSYDGAAELPELTIVAHPNLELIEDQHVLIADDVYDTGKTFDRICQEYGELAASITLLTPYYKPEKTSFRALRPMLMLTNLGLIYGSTSPGMVKSAARCNSV